MANFAQSSTYNQYFGYGTGGGMQWDAAQSKWVQGSSTGNQQNQQQMYQGTGQGGAEYYASAAGYSGYGNQQYGQTNAQSHQDYSMTGSGMAGAGSTGSTSTMGSKTVGNFGSTNSAGTAASSTSSNAGTFGMGGTFGTGSSSAANNTTASNQMYGAAFGMNSNANSNTSSNTASNMNIGGQTFDANTLSQLSQMFGAGFGTNTAGDATGANLGTGYNAFNSGMMTLLQQTLLQQANGGAAFGTGTAWGMPDGSGGYYAPPMDSTFQFGAMGNAGKKGKKWSGKDSNKQDFYGNRFAQLFTGAPGVLGQPQGGKGKRMQDGVRVNVKGERVVDVEVPLSLYSRWGQLRKFFGKQDTEVVKHLLSFHDEMCEDCLHREQRKKKEHEDTASEQGDKAGKSEDQAEEMEELSEEDLALRQLMGFGSFNTTRGAMVEGNQVDSSPAAPANPKPASDSSWEAKAGFIGPKIPTTPSESAETSKAEESKSEDTDKDTSDESKTPGDSALSEEEKSIMQKLGWSVFNKKSQDDKSGGDDDDDGGDDDEKVDDGGQDGAAAEGT